MSLCYICNGYIGIGEFPVYPACELHEAIARMLMEDAELLERLGSDYDENGKPYWD